MHEKWVGWWIFESFVNMAYVLCVKSTTITSVWHYSFSILCECLYLCLFFLFSSFFFAKKKNLMCTNHAIIGFDYLRQPVCVNSQYRKVWFDDVILWIQFYVHNNTTNSVVRQFNNNNKKHIQMNEKKNVAKNRQNGKVFFSLCFLCCSKLTFLPEITKKILSSKMFIVK